MTESMMKAVIDDIDLCVDGEVDACEMLLKWLDHQKQVGNSVQPYQLLTCIRWSCVSVEYIKSKFLNHSLLQADRPSFEFLSRVITYHVTGIQSEGICTFHRTSDGQERNVIKIYHVIKIYQCTWNLKHHVV